MRDVGGSLLDPAVHGRDHLHDGQVEPGREREVAFIVRGYGHDRAGAVVHQHVVGDPDRDTRVVDRIDGVETGEDTRLLLGRGPLLRLLGHRMAHVGTQRLAVRRTRGELLHQRMLGRKHEERRTEQRVRARREHRDVLVELLDPERHLRAVGAADPVALHGQHALGPVELRHVVEQPVGVVGDLEHPLLEVPRFDLVAAALAAAVDHLLVREHGLVEGTPLDGRGLAVREALLEQLQEQPLRPAVVLGLVGRELTRPVERPAHPLHLRANRRDVALGDLTRVAALADRGVLRREAERVVAHRTQHGEAAAPAHVRDDIAERVVEDVAHVQVAGRVGQHLRARRPCSGRHAPDRPGSGSRRRRPRPRPAAISARSLVGRSCPIGASDTKKPLDSRGSVEAGTACAAIASSVR